MKIVTAFISDRGKLYLPGCIDSYYKAGGTAIEVDEIFDDADHLYGMAGNVRRAWQWAIAEDADYLLHVEEDFLFTDPLQLDDMVAILESEKRLAQVVLLRQPWSNEERAAGGIMELKPSAYRPYAVISAGRPIRYVEHNIIFSLNPCLIPRRVLEMGWPDGNEAEFTRMCLDAQRTFAFFGGQNDEPRVAHVGFQRGAGWRL